MEHSVALGQEFDVYSVNIFMGMGALACLDAGEGNSEGRSDIFFDGRQDGMRCVNMPDGMEGTDVSVVLEMWTKNALTDLQMKIPETVPQIYSRRPIRLPDFFSSQDQSAGPRRPSSENL